MAQLFQLGAETLDAKRILWPEPEALPESTLARDATFLRMYPPGRAPRAGSLRSDDVDMDSHWHFHDLHQFFFAFEGAVELFAEDGRHLISQQLAAWIPAGVPHRASLHHVPSISVFFTPDMLDDAGTHIRSVIVTPLMREMVREAARWSLHGPVTPLRKAFFEAMAMLSQEWVVQHETRLFLPATEDPRLRRALKYTDLHMNAKLAEVCRFAGISERSLRRHLRAETGLTWEAYRQRIRLLRSIGLLNETAEPITEIAARCGFESPSAFAKSFRAAMGESPRDYRRGSATPEKRAGD